MCDVGQGQGQHILWHIWGVVSLSTWPDAPSLLAVASGLTQGPSTEDARGRPSGCSTAEWTHLLMQAPRAWRVAISLCSFFSSSRCLSHMAPLEKAP